MFTTVISPEEKFLAELDEQPTLSSTAALLREACGGEPKALICGGETGVKLADALSVARPYSLGSCLGIDGRVSRWDHSGLVIGWVG